MHLIATLAEYFRLLDKLGIIISVNLCIGPPHLTHDGNMFTDGTGTVKRPDLILIAVILAAPRQYH